MRNLELEVNEIKNKLITKDLKWINKYKPINIKTLKELDKEEIEYYTKLIKKIKQKYLEADKSIILEVNYDNTNKIVGLVSKIIINSKDIYIPIEINLVTGYKHKTYMKCSYYNCENVGILYIEEFESNIKRCGFGNLLLKNLDILVHRINDTLESYNKSNCNKFNLISEIRGKSIPKANSISQEALNELYIKNGFEVMDNNCLSKKIEAKVGG